MNLRDLTINLEPAGRALAGTAGTARTSPPPSGGGSGITGNSAPATGGTSKPQGGGGGTSAKEVVLNADPTKAADVAQQSATAASSASGRTAEGEAKSAAKQVNQQIAEASGAESITDLYDRFKTEQLDNLKRQEESGRIDKRQHKELKNRWKNIFNVVPEEDFGLFLMDFGLRMMAASGSGEALGTSIGMAGQGALAGVQERQRYQEGRDMQMEGMAADEAWRKTQLASRPPTPLAGTEGYYQYDPASGEYRAIKDAEGNPIEPLSSYTRPFAKQALQDQLRKLGYPDDEVRRIIAGEPATAELRQIWTQIFDSGLSEEERAAIAGMSPFEWRKVDLATRNEVRRRFVDESIAEIRRGEGITGLPPKPEGFDDY